MTDNLPTVLVVTDNDIVPDEYQHLLISLRDQFTVGYFKVGDVANFLVLRAAMSELRVTQDRVYKAVGNIFGKSSRTIRYYAEQSAFYPQAVRDEYEVLPFSHFVMARSYHQRTGRDWREVLNYGKLNPKASEEEIRFKFLGVVVTGPDDNTQIFIEPTPSYLSSPVTQTVSYPRTSTPSSFLFISKLSEVLDAAAQVIDTVPDAEIAHEISDHIEGLRLLIPAAVRACETCRNTV